MPLLRDGEGEGLPVQLPEVDDVAALCAAMAAQHDPDLDARFRALVEGVRAEHGKAADEVLGPDVLWAAGEDEATEGGGERGDDRGDDERGGTGRRDPDVVGEEGHETEQTQRGDGEAGPEGFPWGAGRDPGDDRGGADQQVSALDACGRRLVEACERALSRGAVETEEEKRATWRAFYAALPATPAPPHPEAWALCRERYAWEAERGARGDVAWEAGDDATREYVARQVQRFTRRTKEEGSEAA